MCLVNSKQALRLSDFAYNIVGSGLSLNGHLLASSPGQIISLTKRTNGNGSAKKGPGIYCKGDL